AGSVRRRATARVLLSGRRPLGLSSGGRVGLRSRLRDDRVTGFGRDVALEVAYFFEAAESLQKVGCAVARREPKCAPGELPLREGRPGSGFVPQPGLDRVLFREGALDGRIAGARDLA